MGDVKLNSSGGGSVTLTPPSTASNLTVTLPSASGTLATTSGTGSVFTNPTINGFTGDTSVVNIGSGQFYKDTSGNLGLGVTPSGWGTNYKASEVKTSAVYDYVGTSGGLVFNAYYNGTNWIYKGTGGNAWATRYEQSAGHTWYTAPSGAAGGTISFTQAMTLNASGNLLVGTTSASVGSGTGFKLVAGVSGTIASRLQLGDTDNTNTGIGYSMYSTGAGAYRFYVGYGGTIYATATTITAISDQRLKENIRDLDDGLATILALKPRKFDWKKGKGKDIKDDRGFIAQEFEQVFPDMIDSWADPAPEGEEPYKAINANLIPTLVKAIQELSAKNSELESRLAALEGK